jgi:hypothetical protein
VGIIFKEDLQYRIMNLRYAISDIEKTLDSHKGRERGYREGKMLAHKGELRFLEGLLQVA